MDNSSERTPPSSENGSLAPAATRIKLRLYYGGQFIKVWLCMCVCNRREGRESASNPGLQLELGLALACLVVFLS